MFLAIVLVFSASCFAQNPFKMTKKQKKELKMLKKEGWKPLNPADDLTEQYLKLCQKEAEVRGDGYYRYSVDHSEVEDANLHSAEVRAWNDACITVRGKQAMKVKSSIKTKDYRDKSGEHSESALAQTAETNYSGSMKDIEKVFAIYKKTKKGYVVKIVAAKENE